MPPQPPIRTGSPAPAPAAPRHFRGVYIGIVLFVLVAAAAGGYVFLKIGKMQSAVDHNQMIATTSPDIVASYRTLGGDLTRSPGDAHLANALETFRTIAADETKSNLERAQALNGINYAYTQSDFDAKTIYDVVFSRPPFSAFYVAATSTKRDIIHPESGTDVQALENALFKLNTLSNALYPNRYAITRMEINTVFEAARETAGETKAQRKASQVSYANQVKTLIEAYDALPAIENDSAYALPMRMQIMYAHAGAIAYVGRILDDASYMQKSEALFRDVIALGDAYPTTNVDSLRILNETLLARIFYATHFWPVYQQSDVNHIKEILQPLLDVERIKETTVYKDFIPSHKDATSATFRTLRLIAAKIPEVKTFLISLGWKF